MRIALRDLLELRPLTDVKIHGLWAMCGVLIADDRWNPSRLGAFLDRGNFRNDRERPSALSSLPHQPDNFRLGPLPDIVNIPDGGNQLVVLERRQQHLSMQKDLQQIARMPVARNQRCLAIVEDQRLRAVPVETARY